MAYLAEAASFAKAKNLRLHLDGARLFNAAVKHQVAAAEITRHFDSVSVCLSKGLGAPVGSLLCGTRAFIEEARKWRKMAGGGMRQAGIIAAAGLFALERNIHRLAEDHDNARRLTEGLGQFPLLTVERDPAQTNMVFFQIQADIAARLADFLRERGILISPGKTTRLVTHLDILAEDVDHILAQMAEFFSQRS
jgi:threonine aldolase